MMPAIMFKRPCLLKCCWLMARARSLRVGDETKKPVRYSAKNDRNNASMACQRHDSRRPTQQPRHGLVSPSCKRDSGISRAARFLQLATMSHLPELLAKNKS
ncbi:hypothetical protein V8C42DRAFT_326387 [Trichoderma barbatum]